MKRLHKTIPCCHASVAASPRSALSHKHLHPQGYSPMWQKPGVLSLCQALCSHPVSVSVLAITSWVVGSGWVWSCWRVSVSVSMSCPAQVLLAFHSLARSHDRPRPRVESTPSLSNLQLPELNPMPPPLYPAAAVHSPAADLPSALEDVELPFWRTVFSPQSYMRTTPSLSNL